MAIINKTNIHYFDKGATLRLESALFLFYDFDDTNYWYIDFHRGWDLLLAVEYVPEHIRELVRERRVVLLLNNSHEAYHDCIDSIYRYFVMDLNLPAEQIRLMTESATIMEEVDRVATMFNKPYIQVDWMRILEYNARTSVHADSHVKLDTLQHKHYDKKYLSLNRRWRQHRPMFVALLDMHGILDKGYVSFCKNVDGQSWDGVYAYMNATTQYLCPELYQTFIDNKDRILNIPDMLLDTPELYTNRINLDNNLDYHYMNTYFSVVNETNFFKDLGEAIFFSEKVFKPMIKCHPFILGARPYSLAKLRELGYKTFSPYIDESYDNETNDYKRLSMIVEETKRLSNLNDNELTDFLNGTKEIVEYNYEYLTTKNTLVQDNFVTILNR